MADKPIAPELLEILACPICKSDVALRSQELVCTNTGCKTVYPVIDGIPVMSILSAKHHEGQRQYFDQEFKGYNNYKFENWRVSYLKRIFTALNIGSSQSDLYLDIGIGGSGYTVIEAARQGCRSVGVDISLEGIRKAQCFSQSELGEGNNSCTFVTCLAEYLPFKNGTFTKTSCIAVLEHLPNDQQAIEEIARVTKPSGKIFIIIPNAYSRIPPVFWLPYYIHDKRIGHLRHYSEEELRTRIEKCCLKVEEISYSGHMIKVLCIMLTKLFPQLEKHDSWLWWKLERADLNQGKDKTGLVINLLIKKLGESSNMLGKAP